MKIGQIGEWTGGTVRRIDPDLPVSEVVTDSREAFAPGALFVALRGEHFDGHDFVEDALDQGAELAMVDEDRWEGNDEVPVVLVEDTLEALQVLAARWRRQFDIPVVGITGSNGKTIVKEMLAGIMARDATVHRSPASYNSQVGVPLSLLGIRAEHDVAIIEAGISRTGEMDRLRQMIRPTHGAITNIGLAHAAGLKTLETTAREKLKLFDDLDEGVLALPRRSEPLETALDERGDDFAPHRVHFGVDSSALEPTDYAVLDARQNGSSDDSGWTFDLRTPLGRHEDIRLEAPGRHNLQNAACAAALAGELGASAEEMRQGFGAFEPTPLRLEMHTTPRGITLINDAYSSDPVSARSALGTLDDYAGGRRTVAILGDMLDLGERSEAAHRDIGRLVARLGVDRLICYGPRARWIGDSAEQHGMPDGAINCVEDLEQLHATLDRVLKSGDVVLFKGSRALELERAAEGLLESVGPTRLHIDLATIRSNYHAIRRRLHDTTKFMAVVKSFGYGQDATRISQTLVRQGVDALAVAYPDEGMPLRERGIELPVLVMNVLENEADKVAKYDLTALVYSRPVVRALAREAEARDTTVKVHIKVDTGMNRVGLRPEKLREFARWVDDLETVELTGVMTHFAAADLSSEDEFTREQIGRFQRALQTVRQADIDPGVVHAANTAATWRWPEAQFDMVRIGLGMYGLSPSDAVAHEDGQTHAAMSFTTQIIHLHEVKEGETVGYGRSWRADTDTRVATIAAGYNDGLPRFMSNGGEVLIGGQRCPIVGDVCMDVAMVDVSHLPDPAIGDEVVIFGDQGDAFISVDEIAERGGTINYEILCNISPRVRRIFSSR
jgi:alanine racemase